MALNTFCLNQFCKCKSEFIKNIDLVPKECGIHNEIKIELDFIRDEYEIMKTCNSMDILQDFLKNKIEISNEKLTKAQQFQYEVGNDGDFIDGRTFMLLSNVECLKFWNQELENIKIISCINNGLKHFIDFLDNLYISFDDNYFDNEMTDYISKIDKIINEKWEQLNLLAPIYLKIYGTDDNIASFILNELYQFKIKYNDYATDKLDYKNAIFRLINAIKSIEIKKATNFGMTTKHDENLKELYSNLKTYKEDYNKLQISTPTEPKEEIKVNDFDFQDEINQLNEQENKLHKGLPMKFIINHLMAFVTSKNPKNNNETYLTEQQFISFIKQGFMNDESQEIQKINYSNGQKGFVILRFYELFEKSVSEYSYPNDKSKFIEMILKCFDNLGNKKQVESYFKPNKTKHKW